MKTSNENYFVSSFHKFLLDIVFIKDAAQIGQLIIPKIKQLPKKRTMYNAIWSWCYNLLELVI